MTGINKKQLQESVSYIKNLTGNAFSETAVVLGSGLGNFADQLTDAISIPMHEIPGYPRPTVEGHSGKIVIGSVSGKTGSYTTRICTFQGRIHYYECGEIPKVLYPVFVMNELGIKNLLITNASGGINQQFTAGDLMIIRDQINLTFRRPFPGDPRHSREPISRFPLYDQERIDLIQRVAIENGIKMQNGIYAGVLGPSYETPSEIQMLRRFGADAIGMSTVLETLQASIFGMKIAGISCITNMAAGLSEEKLSHEDVTITASRVNETFITLLHALLTHPDWK